MVEEITPMQYFARKQSPEAAPYTPYYTLQATPTQDPNLIPLIVLGIVAVVVIGGIIIYAIRK